MSEIEVKEENLTEIKTLILGRKIVEVHRAPDSKEEWVCGENHVILILDDGAELHFDGWGYDASGVDFTYKKS